MNPLAAACQSMQRGAVIGNEECNEEKCYVMFRTNSGRLVHCRSQDWYIAVLLLTLLVLLRWPPLQRHGAIRSGPPGDLLPTLAIETRSTSWHIFLPRRWFVDSVDVSSSKLLGPRPYSRQIRHCPCSLASRVSYRKVETLYITLHHFKRSHRHLGISFKIENTQGGISYGSESWIQQIALTGHGTCFHHLSLTLKSSNNWAIGFAKPVPDTLPALPLVSPGDSPRRVTWGGAAFNGAPDIARSAVSSVEGPGPVQIALRCHWEGPISCALWKICPGWYPPQKKGGRNICPGWTWDYRIPITWFYLSPFWHGES